MAYIPITSEPPPTPNGLQKLRKLLCAFTANLLVFEQQPRAFNQWHPMAARHNLHFLLGFIPQTPFGRIDDALESKVIFRAGDNPKISHCIPNFHALVKSRPTNHPIRQADGQKTIFKSTHLMACTHQNCHIIKPETL